MKNLIKFVVLSALTSTLWSAPYDNILLRLKELDKQPNTSLFTLGKNDQGQDIVGILIGAPTRNTVKHLVVGTHHGNERMAAEVPFHFAELILATLNNPAYRQYRNPNVSFYIIPVLNISGYNTNQRTETFPGGPVDSNRDYEDPCLTKRNFVLKSTGHLARLIEQENIIAAVTVHGYVGTFTFPWGTSAKNYETHDHAFMNDIAQKAARLNGYETGTHGEAIYPANGAFEDWAYYKHGVWSFLLEIRNPMADLRKDAQALYSFFKDVPKERSHNVGQPVDCAQRIIRSALGSRP